MQAERKEAPGAVAGSAKPMRRRAARPGDRCLRWWIRISGRIVRFIQVSNYDDCPNGGVPREFVKRITHRRWNRGWHMFGVQSFPEVAEFYSNLPADEWTEVIVADPPNAQGSGAPKDAR